MRGGGDPPRVSGACRSAVRSRGPERRDASVAVTGPLFRASGGSVGMQTTVSVTRRVLLARWKKAASTYGPIPSGVDRTAWGMGVADRTGARFQRPSLREPTPSPCWCLSD